MKTHPPFVQGGRRAVRRVILVVLDGLRPDAIEAFGLVRLSELVRRGAAALGATTVHPSVTAACMASLLTGVSPERHGLKSSRFHLGRGVFGGLLHPVPKLLKQASLATEAFVCRVPWFMKRIAGRIARTVHVTATFAGSGAAEVLHAATPRLLAKGDGLVILHWPDADDEGHAHGWMSARYGAAARGLDAALGRLVDVIRPFDVDDTLLVVMADHGGGGAGPRDHESAHQLNRTIPIIFAGGGIEPHTLTGAVSLLDVPPTILWALGVPVPGSYHGRPLREIFERSDARAAIA